MSLFEVKDLCRTFRQGDTEIHAVDHVSFTMEKGEMLAIVGQSGSGKTTLLNLLGGIDKPTSGKVLLNGQDIHSLSDDASAKLRRRKIGYIYQDFKLLPILTAKDNILLPATLDGRKLPASEVRALADRLGIGSRLNHLPSQMSGGQRQRTAIARALINEPKVLLLDEPLSALDAKLRSSLLVELDRLHDKIGITFIFVTHDQSEALAVSDRIAVMNKGNVLQIGTPFEIYESPATQFVAQFIGETNLFESTVVKCEGYKAKSGEEYMVTLNTPALGMQAQLAGDTQATKEEDKNILVTDYEHTDEGQKVAFTIRPEKIRITLEEPNVNGRKDINVFKGVVEEPVYTGFQSKFYVKLETTGTIVKVFKQHTNYLDDGPEIQWKDTVYISWSAEDGYIVEDIEK